MKHTLREFLVVSFVVLAAVWTGFAITSCGGDGGGGGGGSKGGGTGIGNITIILDAVPDDAQDFSFSVTGSGLTPFTLDDDGGADSTYSNSKTFSGVSSGAYTITENAVGGWDLSVLSCSGGASTSTDVSLSKATINLKANEDVVCTFTNTKQPSPGSGNITIVKDAVPDDAQDFSFSVTGNGLTSFTLDDDGGADPTYSNSKTVTGLSLATYTVTENAVSGWNLSDLSCTGSSDYTTIGSTATINLQDGEDVVCTFTNTKIPPAIGNITIIKDAVPDDPQDFSFSVTGSGLTPFSLDDDSDGTLSNSASFTGISTGTYTVTENETSGWALTGLTCAGGSNISTSLAQRKATITLQQNEDVICTFTNKSDSKYLYVSNTNEDTISAFSLNANNGELTFIGNTPLFVNSAPTGLALSPDGTYLYSANSNAKSFNNTWGISNISAYLINATGGLEEISGSPFPLSGSSTLVNLAMHPSGFFLYGTDTYNSGQSVRTFLVNSTTGSLEEAAYSPITASNAHSIAMLPSGDYFYVGTTSDTVNGYVINTPAGDFSDAFNSPYTATGRNAWVAVSPDGKYLYTADATYLTGGYIHGFAINGTTGELSDLAGSPYKPAGISNDVRSLLVVPSGKYLYAADWDTNRVSAFVINSIDGSLSNVTGMPFVAGKQPKALATDRLGRFLYVVSYFDHNVSIYNIDQSTGALSFIANTPVGTGPKAIITAP